MVYRLLGGLVGGLIGATIWILIGYFANAEVGIVAWGIGFLVGGGVRYGGYLTDKDEGAGEGIASASLAIVTILAAKFAVFYLLVLGPAGNIESLIDVEGSSESEETFVRRIADDVIAEKTQKGQQLKWPDGVTSETAVEPEDYPAGVWRQAEQKWKDLAEDKKIEMKAEARRELESLKAEIRNQLPGFWETFSLYDGLWIILAVITAFKIGAGTYGSND